ncbi:MAG: DUF2796 domain-containing protein, partial [Pseudomonadales bacterium]|nr:DUF2796 domain-containing protein [Pseudomonadales bacterium]
GAMAQGLDSHVHGVAELNLALLGEQLQLEFISPAMNLLGFERAPASAEESALLEQVTATLQNADWLIGDSLADCQMTVSLFETPEYDADSHDHDHEHDADGHDHSEESHANFHAQYLYDCADSPAKSYNISAFSHFNGLEQITVQWITAGQQGLAQLTAGNSVLNLE